MQRPWAHRARIADLGVEAGDLVAVAGAPDDVGIGRIRVDEAGLAAAERLLPAGVGLTDAAEQRRGLRIGGTTLGIVVLHVGIHPIGHAVVDGDVVHLAYGQLHVVPCLAGRRADFRAAVVADHDPAGVGRIDPDIVVVAAPMDLPERLASVPGEIEGVACNVDLVLVGWRDREANRVTGALRQQPAVALHVPVLAAVIGTPQRPGLRGLDEGIHALRSGRRDGHVDFAHRRVRQAVALDLVPGVTAVMRDINAAGRPAAGHRPRTDFPFPDAGEEDVWILHVHRETRAAGIAIDEEDVFPGFPAIIGAPYAARFLG